MCRTAVQRVIDPVGPHRLTGKVVEGFKRGSKQLGWPTANLDPAAFESRFDASTEGVYVGWAAIRDPTLPEEAQAVHKAVLSMGWNPTYTDVKQRTVEAYLCHDFCGRDFYGAEMRLMICAFLRSNVKFDSFDELIQAITDDVEFGQRALDGAELAPLQRDPFFSSDTSAG
mmetsp:Transcript_41943/g.139061  ORF Transcript_41943/g.139061 Transcript_41943/m.139061 type:complete len:171 (+) Transcript_41943:89-601(+)